ncbi:hypothetical protein BLX87_06010 [Bacillus sp. VT-16-64]|nr:hypothetical protein BLX87_06010 [Bacillus sp. VT-16-64]
MKQNSVSLRKKKKIRIKAPKKCGEKNKNFLHILIESLVNHPQNKRVQKVWFCHSMIFLAYQRKPGHRCYGQIMISSGG